jgi:hypothetical protein
MIKVNIKTDDVSFVGDVNHSRNIPLCIFYFAFLLIC